jgi:hypothetical protein
MNRATHKVLLIIMIVSFWICDIIGQTTILRDTLKIAPLKPKDITSVLMSNVNKESILQIQEQLVGCLCDPVFRNELGISLIGSLKSPIIGLGLDFNPLYFNRLNADLLIRYDFNQDYIINSGLETKYIIRKLPLDFRFEYNRYNLSKTGLNDYQKYLAGLVYRIPWTSMGLLIGQDHYDAKKNIGYEMYIKYDFHKAINKCCEPYKSVADIYTGISCWRDKINYKVKIDYLLNYSISIGIGYEKIYDFNELFITFRQLIFYY